MNAALWQNKVFMQRDNGVPQNQGTQQRLAFGQVRRVQQMATQTGEADKAEPAKQSRSIAVPMVQGKSRLPAQQSRTHQSTSARPHFAPQKGLLTELYSDEQSLQALLPALACMSQQGRWLTWISPPSVPLEQLNSFGAYASSNLLVRPEELPMQTVLEAALASGTSSVVLAWVEEDDQLDQQALSAAAEQGKCWGLIFSKASNAALQLHSQLQ